MFKKINDFLEEFLWECFEIETKQRKEKKENDKKKRLEYFNQFLDDLEEIKLKYEDIPGILYFEAYKHSIPSLTFDLNIDFDNFNNLIEKMKYIYMRNLPSDKIYFLYKNLCCDLDKRFLYNCSIEKIDGKLIIKSPKN